MKLIADSGSTKTQWVLIEQNQVIGDYQTQGINPYYQSAGQIENVFANELLPQLDANVTEQISRIYYYGAGCSSLEQCEKVHKTLAKYFSKATIEVNHDLLGAARAACGAKAGIAAILGTGSNSCLYSGLNILANQPSLGFILGDEGSGGHIGKNLLSQFVYKELTPELHLAFEQTYALTKEMILENIYQKPMPNRYAASFTRFVAEHIKHPQMTELVQHSFSEFFKHHICSYQNYSQYSLSAVGSVAFVFEKQLREVAKQFSITITSVIQNPMEGLIRYHQL